MIDTSFSMRRIPRRLLSPRSRARLGRTARSSAIVRATRPARRRLTSQAGDTLIEVIVSALLVALIVVGTFSGLDSTNKATALQRSRSQADALAEQNEEQLRSEPIKKLFELEGHPTTETVSENGTTYTVETSAAYISDTTATSSCTSSSPKADYIQTASKVTWPSLGVGKAVVETGIISPPPGSTLIVQVTESGTALQGAQVTATGPSPETTAHTLETSSSGCAILAVSPGEYTINVSKSNYVDPNGYANTQEDTSSSVTRSVYLPAETTAKEGYYLGRAGKLSVSFTGSLPAEGDTFVAYNSGMATFRQFGTIEKYASTVLSSATTNVYPFPATSPYIIYAGTCEADIPATSVMEANKTNFYVSVPAGGTGSISTIQPPINIKVLESNKGQTPEKPLQNATVRIEDTGCKTVHESKTNSAGALPRPGMPFGAYSLCVTAKIGVKNRKYTRSITSSSSSGTSLQTIYLGEEGEENAGCP
jgi:Tfp pilus assembly protein PilV